MNNTRFYSYDELSQIPGLTFDEDVKVARTVVLDGKIHIGKGTIISDFTIITGNVRIGMYCHIAHRVHLSGHYNIRCGDFFTIGAGSIVYTESDDHKSTSLIGPQIPSEYRSCYRGSVDFFNHVNIATNCIIMPNTVFLEGTMLRLRSIAVKGVFGPWKEYGSKLPYSNAEFIRNRSDKQLEKAKWFLQQQN